MLKEDLRQDVEARVAFLKKALAQAGAKGFVYGNSGGKDCTLVGILCKLACENTFGVCMPCSSSQNYGRDLRDGMLAARAFGIETVTVDLSQTKDALMAAVTGRAPRGGKRRRERGPRACAWPRCTPWPKRAARWWRARATAASATLAILPSGATAPAT